MSERDVEDGHAHVRFFKLVEVAYHAASHGYYRTSYDVLLAAAQHFEEAAVPDRSRRAASVDDGDTPATADQTEVPSDA